MVHQINIFVDNKPGKLKLIAETLSRAAVNIHAVTIQDRGEFGLMKLLVDQPEKAHVVLQERGCACALKEICAVLIDDKPGALLRLATVFDEEGINVVDAYSYTLSSRQRAVWCSEVEDVHHAEHVLARHGFSMVSDADLAEL